MNTVFRTRQRAEEFAALVDGTAAPLREVQAGHEIFKVATGEER